MSTFHNMNLLYRPSLSIWTARKKDKGESTKVTENAAAQAGAANVYKALLPDNPKLDAVRKWGDGFRDFIYTNTLPWDDAGNRIGRADRHMEFMAKAGDKIKEGELLVEAFLADYAIAIENAKFSLANLFDESDYPGVDEVRTKFKFTLDVSTLPNAEDFRVVDGVPKEDVDKLVAIAKNSVETRVQSAMDTAYTKLFDVVSKMARTLEQFGNGEIKKFNDTLVGNIAELVDAMPALNITGDPKLANLAVQAKELAQYAAVDLRKDKAVREAAIKEAQALAKAFGADEVVPYEQAASRAAAPRAADPAPTTVPRRPPPPPKRDVPTGESMRATFADMMSGDD